MSVRATTSHSAFTPISNSKDADWFANRDWETKEIKGFVATADVRNTRKIIGLVASSSVIKDYRRAHFAIDALSQFNTYERLVVFIGALKESRNLVNRIDVDALLFQNSHTGTGVQPFLQQLPPIIEKILKIEKGDRKFDDLLSQWKEAELIIAQLGSKSSRESIDPNTLIQTCEFAPDIFPFAKVLGWCNAKIAKAIILQLVENSKRIACGLFSSNMGRGSSFSGNSDVENPLAAALECMEERLSTFIEVLKLFRKDPMAKNVIHELFTYHAEAVGIRTIPPLIKKALNVECSTLGEKEKDSALAALCAPKAVDQKQRFIVV